MLPQSGIEALTWAGIESTGQAYAAIAACWKRKVKSTASATRNAVWRRRKMPSFTPCALHAGHLSAAMKRPKSRWGMAWRRHTASQHRTVTADVEQPRTGRRRSAMFSHRSYRRVACVSYIAAKEMTSTKARRPRAPLMPGLERTTGRGRGSGGGSRRHRSPARNERDGSTSSRHRSDRHELWSARQDFVTAHTRVPFAPPPLPQTFSVPGLPRPSGACAVLGPER